MCENIEIMTSNKADDILKIPKINYLPEYQIMKVINITCSNNIEDKIYISNKYVLRNNTLIKINNYHFDVGLLVAIDCDQIAISEKYRKIIGLNELFPYGEIVMIHSQKINNKYDIYNCKVR